MRTPGRFLSLLTLVGISGVSGSVANGGVRDLWHALCGHDECQTCRTTTVYVDECPECSRQPRKKKERACCLCPPLPPRAPVGFAFPAELQGGFPEEDKEKDEDKANEQAVPPDLEARLNTLEEHLTRLTAIVDRVQKRQLPEEEAAPTPAPAPVEQPAQPEKSALLKPQPRQEIRAVKQDGRPGSYIAPPRPLFEEASIPAEPR